MTRLLIVGAGGHGRVVAETALASGRWSEVAFVDRSFPTVLRPEQGVVIGTDADAGRHLGDYREAIVAIGDNHARVAQLELLAKLGFDLPVIVHPGCWVSPSARLGAGSVVLAGAVINAGASLGRACIVNTGASVDHDCVLGDGVHVAPGAHLGGHTIVGAASWIGIGAVVRHRVKIGAAVVVGAGGAVVTDLADGVTVAGVPARVL